MAQTSQIGRVAIVGGTHGNELIGPCLIEKWRTRSELVKRSSFETLLLLGNPMACDKKLRYIDRDLNRCFDPTDLKLADPLAYEVERARTLVAKLGPAGDQPTDLLIDLHTTTANMRATVILVDQKPFNLQLAAALKALEAEVYVFLWTDEKLPRSALTSVTRYGVTIEMGPTPNNVLRADLLLKAEKLVHGCLDFCENYNRKTSSVELAQTLEVFRYVDRVDYPRDAEGRIRAAVHPDLQDRDYEPLRPGDPMFLTFDGETIRFGGAEALTPVFINEAAYYEKELAFCLTRPETLRL